MSNLDDCKCDLGSLFPIEPRDYEALKTALKVFGGKARIYDQGGDIIEPETGNKTLSAFESMTSKQHRTPNLRVRKRS